MAKIPAPTYPGFMSTAPAKITNAQLESLLGALRSLDGIKNKDEVFFFKFDEDTTWNIACLIVEVDSRLRAYNVAKKKIALANGVVEGMKIEEKNASSISQFLNEIEELRQREVDSSGLPTIARSKLDFKRNGIPPNVLAGLMPILTE